MNLEFSRQIFENPQISTLMKIPLKRAEVFHTDGRTDMTKLKVAFCNFVKAPNIREFDSKFNAVCSYLVCGEKDDSAFGGWL